MLGMCCCSFGAPALLRDRLEASMFEPAHALKLAFCAGSDGVLRDTVGCGRAHSTDTALHHKVWC